MRRRRAHTDDRIFVHTYRSFERGNAAMTRELGNMLTTGWLIYSIQQVGEIVNVDLCREES